MHELEPVRRRVAAFDIVAIAASSGGLEAASELLAALPADFPAPILLVQHRTPEYEHLLIEILQRRVALRVVAARAGSRLRGGTIYVAPAGRQALVTPCHTLQVGEPRSGQWPLLRGTADPLFNSVAQVYGERAIAVVLTGRLTDGARGAQAIKARGGRVLVQDLRSAVAAAMPRAALATGCSDFAFAPTMLARVLIALVMVPGAAALFHVPARLRSGAPTVLEPAAYLAG
jgi:two-component system chemotaxis response regulator CheB